MSIFKNTKTSKESLESNIQIQSIIPHELWGITKFKGNQTKLVNLFTKNMDLTKKKQELEQEQINMVERRKDLISKYAKDIDNHVADLDREKEIKTNEFKFRKKELRDNKDKKISKRLKELKGYNDELLGKYKKEQTIQLSKYRKTSAYIDEILSKYDVKVEGKVEKLNISDITEEEMRDIIDDIDYYIESVLSDHITPDRLVDKVKGMDKKQSAAAAIFGAITTVLFAPVVLAGATVWIGSLAHLNKKAQAEVQGYVEKLLRLKSFCDEKFEEWSNMPPPDTSDIKEEIKRVCNSAETEYKNALDRLVKEEKDWLESFNERSEQSKIDNLALKRDNEVQALEMSQAKRIEILKTNLIKAEEEYKVALKEFQEENKVPPYLSDESLKLRIAIKELKGIVSDYVRFRNLEKLDYNFKLSPDDDIVSRRKKEYTRELYHEVYLPLKTKIDNWEKEKKTEDFWESLYKANMKKEDDYFILNTGKLHLGDIQQDAKYSALKEDEKCMATDWSNHSILLVYKNEAEELALINYVKYLTHQVLGITSPEAVEVNIVNKAMDTKFNDITINTNTVNSDGKTIKNPLYVTNFSGGEVDTLLENQKKLLVSRHRKELVGGGTISEIIRKKREQGSKTPKYIINILHREGIDSGFYEFNENSPRTGIINICLVSQEHIVSKDPISGVVKFNDNVRTKLDKTPILIEYVQESGSGTHILSMHQKHTQSYNMIKYKELSRTDIEKATAFFKDRYMKDLNLKTGYSIDEFILDVVGDNFYQEDAAKGVKLFPGYVDGDKSIYTPIILDEQDMPHMFLGGTTGGGKSVTLATMCAMTKVMYSPSQLNIIYFDFKVVEVAVQAAPYKWPNASVLSGSKNPEYLISLLNELVKIMEKRYNDMQKLQINSFSKYQAYLKKLKKEFMDKGDYARADKVDVPPRLLVIIDEFAEGFRINDDVSEVMKIIITKLLALGRAAGLNLFALSQDPGSSVPPNVMDLFKVRACTKATADVSKSVMKNDFCAQPENQYLGFLGANSSGTGDTEANVRYVVPFTADSDTKMYSKMVNDLLHTFNETSRDAIIFDEDERCTQKDLAAYIDERGVQSRQIILGEPVKYQDIYSMWGLDLRLEDKQGISFASTDRNAKIDFIKTIASSVNKDESAKVGIFFAKEAYDDINLKTVFKRHIFIAEDDVTPELVSEIDYDKSEEETGIRVNMGQTIVDAMENILTTRKALYKETGVRNRDPIYIIAIDPDISQDIIADYVWSSKEVIAMFNECSRWGIYMVQVCSSMYFLEKEPPYLGYLIGTKMGTDAEMLKRFKKIDDKFTKMANMINDANSFQFKLPASREKELLPWEEDIA